MQLELKSIGVRAMKLLLLYGLIFEGLLSLAWGANVSPAFQDTVVNQTIDRMNLPQKVFIWNKIFGGSGSNCSNRVNCKDNDQYNALTCMNSTNTLVGACPSMLYWTYTYPSDNQLTLLFTHSNGETKELKVTSIKTTTKAASWYVLSVLVADGFTVYIPSTELNKLSLAGVWRAALTMRVSAWDNCSDDVNGCWGMLRAIWRADITLNVKGQSNPQIYLPAFPTAAPVIDLNLVTRSGGKIASGSANLDMCLYDGNDSTSNRISLLLRDEGAAVADRPKGQFSLYRRGGNKDKARERLDYQISVVNPTTGASQAVSNGTQIIWNNTNQRDIQRQVILPGVTEPVFCVPAPLTLITPSFPLADKTAGDYTGTLRIIYTPTTQTAQ